MTNHDCRDCPPPCRRTDCPHADREWRPGAEEDELKLAQELIGEDDE